MTNSEKKNPAVLLQTMDPTEARRSIPLPGEPGTPEDRHLCELSPGMTLEGNHIASTALDTMLLCSISPWPPSEFTFNRGDPSPSQAPVPLSFSV